MDLIFELDGNIVDAPRNWKELEIELSFENSNPSGSLSANSFEFVGNNALLINQYIEDGKSSGLGLFEGIPFNIYAYCDGVKMNLLESVLDLAASDAEYDCDIVKVPIREIEKIDFLNETADSFGMNFLHRSEGTVTSADFVDVHYSIEGLPKGLEAAIAALSIYVMAKDVLNLGETAVDKVADGVSVAVPTTGVSVGLGAGVVTSWNFATIAAKILQVAFTLIKYGLLLLALYELAKQLANALFPVVRIHRGMKVLTMLEKGCDYLGYTLSSSIFQGGDFENMVIIPPKNNKGALLNFGQKSKEIGYDPNETFGDLLRSLIDMFNAKIKIVGKQLVFERRDFFTKNAPFTMPDVRIDFNGTNAHEIASNYLIKYTFDSSDLQSLDGSIGYSTQNTVRSLAIGNPNRRFSRSLMKNLTRKDLKYSHVKRRGNVTPEQEILANLAAGIGKVFTFLGGGSTKGMGKVDLIGTWVMQTDYSSVSRVAFVTGNRIDADSKQRLSASKLYEDFHYIESPVKSSNLKTPNQYLTYKDITIPLCCEDFLKLQNTNLMNTVDGRIARIDSLKYNIFEQTANIDFSIQQVYTSNLEEVRTIDGGDSVIITKFN